MAGALDMALDPGAVTALTDRAREIRRLLLKTCYRAQCGHTGGSLSAAEIMAVLYFHSMQGLDPEQPRHPDRDRFILSKGHATPVYYATLALRGYLSPEELLETYDRNATRLQGHPDMNRLPGVDMSTGSLGQGLSCGIGMALGARYGCRSFRTFVLLGCGELQEGQVWEAAMFAGSHRLGNLIAIVDSNQLQLSGWTHQVLDHSPLAPKWEAFGWRVQEVDGHSVADLMRALDTARSATDQPQLILARTLKGKGFSVAEGQVEWHSHPPTEEELQLALAELGEPA